MSRTWIGAGLAMGLALTGAGVTGAEEVAFGAEPALGTRVRIRLDEKTGRRRGGRELTGRLIETGVDRFVVISERDRRPVTVRRAAVERFDVSRGRGRRGAAALKGGALGLGVGLLFLGSIHAGCDEDNGLDCLGSGAALVYGTPLLAAAGMGIGLAVGQERWETVEPPRRPRLAIAPTVGQGIGARLAFSF